MDKTALVAQVAHLFEISGYKVDKSVRINHREIDVVAEELHGLLRKIVLIECADYEENVGVDKLQTDLLKLRAAQETLRDRAVIMHVARNGYTPDASGYAMDQGISTATLRSLTAQLVNFDPYLEAVDRDSLRPVILQEYQPTKMHLEGRAHQSLPAVEFLDYWLTTAQSWLTVVGDYGVGKSWMLKRFLYHLVDLYRRDPATMPLPFFIPLQRFTKSFDYQNLVLKTFQQYGLSGVHYAAFEYLANNGRIVFLLDSFDEMAQTLSREVLRENLKELLTGISRNCRAIMTSRPTYFEHRAERLLTVEHSTLQWHPLDKMEMARKAGVSVVMKARLEDSRFARLSDLSVAQRKALFAIVLGKRPQAHRALMGLYSRFQELETISQRAVIARLLTTVAETLASSTQVNTLEGYPLLPQDLVKLNQAKIFEIVVYNLLHRDSNIGTLSAADRLRFLRSFAVHLQRPDTDLFAGPEELRDLVESLYKFHLQRTDTPEQLLENYYRACRRHSGLTTEGQFLDTSGNIDVPVDEEDTESRVGFSHNSLREYLVADAFVDFIRNGVEYAGLAIATVSELVGEFVRGMAEYLEDLTTKLAERYRECQDPRMRQSLFRIIQVFIRSDSSLLGSLLGAPARLNALDMSGSDFSGLSLRDAQFTDCIGLETDFRKSDLRQASFPGCVLANSMFDAAQLEGTDLTSADIESIYVLDMFQHANLRRPPRQGGSAVALLKRRQGISRR
jgi:hypothetical protein